MHITLIQYIFDTIASMHKMQSCFKSFEITSFLRPKCGFGADVQMNEIGFTVIANTSCFQGTSSVAQVFKSNMFKTYIYRFALHMEAIFSDSFAFFMSGFCSSVDFLFPWRQLLKVRGGGGQARFGGWEGDKHFREV